jgi:hypothetical protein
MCEYHDLLSMAPNGLRLSRLADCALVGSVYNKRHRRRYAPYILAEGQVGSNRGLGAKPMRFLGP